MNQELWLHRDMNPRNILFEEDTGRCVVFDAGESTKVQSLEGFQELTWGLEVRSIQN